MAKARFFQRDSGYSDLMTTFKLNKGEEAAIVGYLASSGQYKSGEPVSVAQVAAINEYGSSDGKIPERSFFRSTLREQEKKLTDMARKFTLEVLEGKRKKKSALGIMAETLLTAIKNKIQKGVPPANAPSTIAAKGSDHTLIDTGRMRDSLDWEIKKGK